MVTVASEKGGKESDKQVQEVGIARKKKKRDNKALKKGRNERKEERDERAESGGSWVGPELPSAQTIKMS